MKNILIKFVSSIIFYFSISAFYSFNSHKMLLNYFASNHISFLISIFLHYLQFL